MTLDPSRRGGAFRLGVALAVAFAFALSLGLNFGVGGQATYLIAALRHVDPTLLTRDWFATQTTCYHPVFMQLGAWLLELNRQGKVLAFGLTVTVTLASTALYLLARALVGAGRALPAFLLCMAFVFVNRTQGPAVSYVFDRVLQPSTLGAAFFIGAAAAFVAGSFGLSGVLLAVSGLCHLNLLLLLFPSFGIAAAVLERRDRIRRSVLVLALPALSCLAFLPLFLRAGTSGANAALARHIWLVVRLPHHFVLQGHLAGFLPLIAWQLFGFGLIRPLIEARQGRPFARAGALILGLVTVIWLGILLAPISDRVRLLFPWRLVPFAELLFEITTSAAAVRWILEPELWRAATTGTKVTIGLGLAALLGIEAARNDKREALVLVGALALGAGFRFARARHAGEGLLTLLWGVLLINFAVGPLLRIPIHSSLTGDGSASLTSLQVWMRERTPKSALFLTPPSESTLRLLGERAIVVDWKNAPGAIPNEVLEWYRRIGDVIGQSDVRSDKDLEGYNRLDPARLETLRRRYGFDFAVIRRAHADSFRAYPRAFENAEFVVLRVDAGPPGSRTGSMPGEGLDLVPN